MNRSPPRASTPAFSTPDFRAALGMFATGVTIVTARDPAGLPVGITANSFNSVSLAPPLVLWSLARDRRLDAGVRARLALRDQHPRRRSAHARAALRREGDRPLRRRAVPDGPSGAPVLDGAAAVFECFNRSRYEEGDHVIFVGEVERCAHRPGAQPLIFHGGRYFTELPL